MSDTTQKNAELLNAAIGGPSHEDLLRPFSKSVDQIAREQQKEHEASVKTFNGGK
jgi:hypothetical protein